MNALRRLSDRTPLRTKLIAAVLALVTIALAAISVASVAMLRDYVVTRPDASLRASVANYFGTVNLPQQRSITGPQPIQPGYAYPTNSDIIYALQVPGHQVSWYGVNLSGGSPASLPQLPTSNTWADAADGVTLTVPSQSGPDSWRVTAQTNDYPFFNTSTGNIQQQTLTLVAAVDVGDINAMTTRLVLFDLIVGLAILSVLAAVGVGVVRANLRPLNDIEVTAGQIAAGHLNQRVPEGDPRTEVGSLGESLNAMLSQIESAFHAQQESQQAAHDSEERMRRFIADASHELRTPLTTIRGFAAYYRQRGGAALGEDHIRSSGTARDSSAPTAEAGDADGTRAVLDSAVRARELAAAGDGLSRDDLDHIMERLEAEATRMGLLVEDLLTLARLDQQRPLSMGPVDLLTLAVDAVQDARMVAPGRPVDLSVAPGSAFLVEGDEARLRQVVGNLVNNALTHTPAGTAVRLRLESGALPSGAPAAVLHVADDGPGMTEEQAQRVFERFYRADAARNRASGGTGLGLAIVSGLVAAHGGVVSVRTAPGEGADFEVKLPLSPDAAATDDVADEE